MDLTKIKLDEGEISLVASKNEEMMNQRISCRRSY